MTRGLIQKKVLIGILAIAWIFPAFSNSVFANELRESDQARELFHKSLEFILEENKIPTFQGHRTIIVFDHDGFSRTFKMQDGYSVKHGGYHSVPENAPPARPRHDQPGPGHERGPKPGQGRERRPKGPPPRHPGEGQGPPGRPGDQNPENVPQDKLERLRMLIDFNRPNMEPIFSGQKPIAKKLIKNNEHLVLKGPVDAQIAGRKTWMIEISPRYYKGGFLRIWLDRETGIPLKKERINSLGKLTYSTEYNEIEFVDDKDFELKDAEKRPELREIFKERSQNGKRIPMELFQQPPHERAPIFTGSHGFDMINMRKVPNPGLPGMHFIFSDGVNTISVFHFDVSRIKDKKHITVFSKKLSEKLNSTLPYPVLLKQDDDGFILITGDIDKDDLKKIAASIAMKNARELNNIKEKIKDRRMQQDTKPPR